MSIPIEFIYKKDFPVPPKKELGIILAKESIIEDILNKAFEKIMKKTKLKITYCTVDINNAD